MLQSPSPGYFAPHTREWERLATEGKELIDRRDYEHDAYLGRYYGAGQHQPYLYHLLINTSLFSAGGPFNTRGLPTVKGQ